MKYVFFCFFVSTLMSCGDKPQPESVLQITAEEILVAVKSNGINLQMNETYSVLSEEFPDSILVEGIQLQILNPDSTFSEVKLHFYQVNDSLDRALIHSILLKRYDDWRLEQRMLSDSYMQVPPPEVRMQENLIIHLEGGFDRSDQLPVLEVIDSILQL